ncbi:50S ribosomal protein L18e [Candidatus Woesearchaeota archaeon]|nr:50S ribosomal protein L18e [Candidatus Woesearchaeota archaeon]
MRTGPTNEQLRRLIEELRKKAYAEKAMLWKRIAADLEKPTRNRRAVNLSRINRHAAEGETVVVPGKVLSSGVLEKPVTIAAWSFSRQAEEKISRANAKSMTIAELMSSSDGKNVRIIG